MCRLPGDLASTPEQRERTTNKKVMFLVKLFIMGYWLGLEDHQFAGFDPMRGLHGDHIYAGRSEMPRQTVFTIMIATHFLHFVSIQVVDAYRYRACLGQ